MTTALLLLGACYPPERFEEAVYEATCEWAIECFGSPETTIGDYDYCADEPEPYEPTCAYDGGKARTCVREIEDMDCPRAGEEPAFPLACDQVYDCSEEYDG